MNDPLHTPGSGFDPVLEWARAIGKPVSQVTPSEAIAAKLLAQRFGAVSEKARIFRVHVDCWYMPHRNPGAKEKKPVCQPTFVMLEATDTEAAIKAAREWADTTAPGSRGRKLVSIEQRSAATVKLPMRVDHK